ncbi:MAG: hypothetical protein WCI67_04675 [Chloroflexales bacterium]
MSDDKRKPNKQTRIRFASVNPTTLAALPARLWQPSAPACAPPSLVLRTLEHSEAPGYAGLRRDQRGVVVGTQGVVMVQGEQELVRLLVALSQIIDMSDGVTLETSAGGPALILLTPPPEMAAPSQFYDGVQGALEAARLRASRAMLYVGDGQIFVAYANPAAPHGCDVGGSPPADGRALLRPGEPTLTPDAQPTPLLEALLHVPLQPAPEPTPNTLSLLTDRRMAALIAGYVQRHGMAYGVRFLSWRRGGQARSAALFDIVSAAELRPPPRFVCDFLRRLPATTLLCDALEPADLEREPARRALVAWGQRTPLHLPHVQDLLPDHSLLILAGDPWGTAVIAAPAPRTTMQQITKVVINAPVSVGQSTRSPEGLRLRLELRCRTSGSGAVHGLLLDAPAIARLQRIVRHLPGPLFAHARIALGDGIALVLAADHDELSGLPLGAPLTRSEPPTLLIPCGMCLQPALPQDLLIPTLGLQPDMFTVLTPARRYDMPLAAFQPLASLLHLDAPAPVGWIKMRLSDLPPLDLSDLEDLPTQAAQPELRQKADSAALIDNAQRSQPERLHGTKKADGQPAASFERDLLRHAAELEQTGAYELAAAFYAYLKDEQRAAACYQRLAQGEKT